MVKASQAHVIYNIIEANRERTHSEASQSGLFMAPMETDNSRWDMSEFEQQNEKSVNGSMLSIRVDDINKPLPLRSRLESRPANLNGMDLKIDLEMDKVSSEEELFEHALLTQNNNDVTPTKNHENRTDRDTDRSIAA
jgi:hypothetical protein